MRFPVPLSRFTRGIKGATCCCLPFRFGKRRCFLSFFFRLLRPLLRLLILLLPFGGKNPFVALFSAPDSISCTASIYKSYMGESLKRQYRSFQESKWSNPCMRIHIAVLCHSYPPPAFQSLEYNTSGQRRRERLFLRGKTGSVSPVGKI